MPILPTPAAAEASLWAIILFPLAGALFNGLFGRRLGKANVTLVAIGAMVGSLAVAVIAFSWVLTTRNLRFVGDPWINVAKIRLDIPNRKLELLVADVTTLA